MPDILRSLTEKLKKLRRPRSRPSSRITNGDASAQVDAALTTRMANMVLADSTAGSTPAKQSVAQPHVFGTQDYEFDFKFDEPLDAWPGPAYDEQSQFAPGVFDRPRPSKRKTERQSSKRRLSRETESKLFTRWPKEPPKAKAVKEKTLSPLQYYGPPPVRDPPVHFLNLPGEIRNLIYGMICVSEKPLVASFRPIMGHKKQRRLGRGSKLIDEERRFPREPALAAVCRQVNREVLSIFYGENKFTFHRSEIYQLRLMLTTSAYMLKKWTPRQPEFLKYVELHFDDWFPGFGIQHLRYVFRELPDGTLSITDNSQNSRYCECFERKVVENFVALRRSVIEGNLMGQVSSFAKERRLAITNRHLNSSGPGVVEVLGLNCKDCGLMITGLGSAA